MTDERVERDSMGEVRVQASAKWRAQTQRAVENFPISGTPIEPALVHALGHVKAAAAVANGADLGDAVFAAAPDTVSAPIKSPFGYQVVRVTKVLPGLSRSLDQARGEIAKAVAQARAVDLVYARANKLDEALSAGTAFDDLSGDLGAAGNLLLEPLRGALRAGAIHSAADDVEVVEGEFGGRAEVLGALALAIRMVRL